MAPIFGDHVHGRLNAIIDWFIPDSVRGNQSELVLARNFVLLHLPGPLMPAHLALECV